MPAPNRSTEVKNAALLTTSARSAERGLSLLEIMLSLAVLMVMSLTSMFQLVSSQTLAHDAELRRIALEAAQNEIERLHTLDYDLVDDEDGVTFSVPGLDLRTSTTTHGIIRVFGDETDPNNPGLQVNPDDAGGSLGNDPADLLTAAMHPPGDLTSYRAIPLEIEVTYPTRSGGEASVTVVTVVSPSTFFDE